MFVGSLEDQAPAVVTDSDSKAIHANGYLLFMRQRALLAQPFDVETGRSTGEPVPIADGVARTSSGRAAFSASDSGVWAFRTGGESLSRLAWYDRSRGQRIGSIGDRTYYREIALSPDGRRIAAEQRNPQHGELEIWLVDVLRSTSTRFTTRGRRGGSHVVTRFDSTRVLAYLQRRSQYVRADPGEESDKLLLESNETRYAKDWSPDGRFLAFTTLDPVGYMPAACGETRTNRLPGRHFSEGQGAVLPRWAMDRVSVHRIRSDGCVRPVLPCARRQDPHYIHRLCPANLARRWTELDLR